MQIVRDLAGYSLGRADLVQCVMAKKKLEVMAKGKRNIYTWSSRRKWEHNNTRLCKKWNRRKNLLTRYLTRCLNLQNTLSINHTLLAMQLYHIDSILKSILSNRIYGSNAKQLLRKS